MVSLFPMNEGVMIQIRLGTWDRLLADHAPISHTHSIQGSQQGRAGKNKELKSKHHIDLRHIHNLVTCQNCYHFACSLHFRQLVLHWNGFYQGAQKKRCNANVTRSSESCLLVRVWPISSRGADRMENLEIAWLHYSRGSSAFANQFLIADDLPPSRVSFLGPTSLSGLLEAGPGP